MSARAAFRPSQVIAIVLLQGIVFAGPVFAAGELDDDRRVPQQQYDLAFHVESTRTSTTTEPGCTCANPC
jgi:hypothetical protein